VTYNGAGSARALVGRAAGLAAVVALTAVGLVPVVGAGAANAATTATDTAASTAARGWGGWGGWGSWNGWSNDNTSVPVTLGQVRTIVDADQGAAATLTGAGIGVALIDTGVAPVAGLPANKIVNGPDLSFESQTANLRYLDTYGHGTHLAGIIVANDVASGSKGIAPGAKLTSLKVGTSAGATDISQVLAAIDWVVQHRNDDTANPIRVLNLSYGVFSKAQAGDPLMFAVERAWKAGIVVVASGGNDDNSTKLSNPALDPYIIAVGASDPNGTTDTDDDDLASFTTVSSTRQVDLLAPGQSIESLRNPGSTADLESPDARVGSTLFRGSGSSQAAAVVSAAAALVLQSNKALTPDQVKAKLVAGATPFAAGIAKRKGLKALSVTGALAAGTGTAQAWTRSDGTGSLESSRGDSHVTRDSNPLTGETSIFGAFNTTTWAARSGAGTAWSGGVWMGNRMAGDGWTGVSWASRTWAPATWAVGYWGADGWLDPGWTARYWSGAGWAGGDWSARYWSSDGWETHGWS
jgi:serine protease AprX